MTKKFLNVIIPTFGTAHVQAVVNEALRLGYKPCPAMHSSAVFAEDVLCAHLEGTGHYFLYTMHTADEIVTHPEEIYQGAVILKNLRKLRGEFDLLNTVTTRSQDNQAALIVRPKYQVAVKRTVSELAREYGTPVDYNESNYLCPCLGISAEQRKTCTLARSYGSTKCEAPSVRAARLLNKPQVPEDIQWTPVVWNRPTAENPLLTNLVRWSVLAGTKIVSVVKRVFSFLRGGK